MSETRTQGETTMLKELASLGINVNMLTRHANLGDARRMASSFTDVRLVVMGCDGRYWVVSARDAGKLRKVGYETI
jgi:hypothetical protein